MRMAVEGAFAWVMIAVTLLPLVLWLLARARRELEERDAKVDELIAILRKLE
jgi:hypothetical protein